jgi:hypothetical protein
MRLRFRLHVFDYVFAFFRILDPNGLFDDDTIFLAEFVHANNRCYKSCGNDAYNHYHYDLLTTVMVILMLCRSWITAMNGFLDVAFGLQTRTTGRRLLPSLREHKLIGTIIRFEAQWVAFIVAMISHSHFEKLGLCIVICAV